MVEPEGRAVKDSASERRRDRPMAQATSRKCREGWYPRQESNLRTWFRKSAFTMFCSTIPSRLDSLLSITVQGRPGVFRRVATFLAVNIPGVCSSMQRLGCVTLDNPGRRACSLATSQGRGTRRPGRCEDSAAAAASRKTRGASDFLYGLGNLGPRARPFFKVTRVRVCVHRRACLQEVPWPSL